MSVVTQLSGRHAAVVRASASERQAGRFAAVSGCSVAPRLPQPPCGILRRRMSQESTTPDVAELTRLMMEAANRHDLGIVMQFHAPDAVWDLSEVGLGTYEGADAIGGLLESWWGTWGSHLIEVEEALDLGNGVVFSSQREHSRLAGSEGHVEQRVLWVIEWANGVVTRQTGYLDIDAARAAAERLAEERG